jgi:endonuclease/exonuclease/phosphatase (EEP) superfamily protein YafD
VALSPFHAPKIYIPRIQGPKLTLPARDFAPTECPARKPASITALTLNVLGLPSYVTSLPDHRFDRLAQNIAEVQPDIIFMQEVFFRAATRSFPRGYHQVTGNLEAFFLRRSGLAILTLEAPSRAHAFTFGLRSGKDLFISKGALLVVINKKDGEKLHLWCAHNQCGESLKDQDIRKSQLLELKGWIEEHSAGVKKVILALDANITPSDILYGDVLRYILGPETKTHQTLATHHDRKYGALHLDHILWRGLEIEGDAAIPFHTYEERLGEKDPKCITDHKPVELKFSR